jgi:hypothetical protein
MVVLVDSRDGRTALVTRTRLLRVCVRLDPVSNAGNLRALVTADLLRRVVEDVHGGQVLLVVTTPADPANLLPDLDALLIRPPAGTLDSFTAADAALGGPADVVVACPAPDGAADVFPEALHLRVGHTEIALTTDVLATHLALFAHRYGQPVCLTSTELDVAAATLSRWRGRVAAWADHPSRPVPRWAVNRARAALDDNLDVRTTLDVLRVLVNGETVAPGAKFEMFVHLDRVLGLDLVRDLGTVSPCPRR